MASPEAPLVEWTPGVRLERFLNGKMRNMHEVLASKDLEIVVTTNPSSLIRKLGGIDAVYQ
jgi:hypothetical protein